MPYVERSWAVRAHRSVIKAKGHGLKVRGQEPEGRGEGSGQKGKGQSFESENVKDRHQGLKGQGSEPQATGHSWGQHSGVLRSNTHRCQVRGLSQEPEVMHEGVKGQVHGLKSGKSSVRIKSQWPELQGEKPGFRGHASKVIYERVVIRGEWGEGLQGWCWSKAQGASVRGQKAMAEKVSHGKSLWVNCQGSRIRGRR